MGGKQKQANRTKNNARPSSSSHSAELLGNTIPTFFGFATVRDGNSAVPSDEANYSINSDFQILFKQMNKKDPTTRFKALQMFTELCNSLDVDSVKAILPLWPRLYCTLCTDIDHKVREAAHYAHHAVVSKVKKMIAPYLKELAGPWFTSQYDTYAPAASAATQAFEEAFPPSKQEKAIVFCQEEILSYIYDNLINQTPQTLCNPNTTSPEDMQAKYERIIIASLQGYILYLEKLSTDQIQEAEERNRNLLSNPIFWKYSRNKVAQIRSCFFHVLIALCQNAKFLLRGESSRLSSAVFNNLDESDPVVLHAVWEAALNVLVTVEDCWSHINLEKQVFKQLCKILKTGGRNMLTIYPNILPLLSKLPEDMIKEKGTFYGNLFGNMRCGLEAGSIGQSKSEAKVIARTFVECLKYIIMRNSNDLNFCSSLVENQLIAALETKLRENRFKKSSLSAPFLTETAYLIRYWYSNRSTGNEAYERLVDVFFESLYHMYNRQLDSEVTQNGLTDLLSNQIDFLSILVDPDHYAPKMKGRVKFDKEDESDVVESDDVKSNDTDFQEAMGPLVKKLAAVYFISAVKKENKSYIYPLSKLVELFDSRVIFEEMVVAVDESTCFKLFTSYFSKWLMNPDMKCGELVDLSFGLLRHVTHDEKEYILEEFYNNSFSDTLQVNVCKALPNYSEDDRIIRWVRSERFSKSILSLVEKFIDGDGDDLTSRDILIMLLKAKCANGDLILDSRTVGCIMESVSDTLIRTDDKTHVIELGEDLVLNAKAEQIKEASFEKLVASLFRLWCCKPTEENLPEACKTGLGTVLSNCQKLNAVLEFTEKLSEVVTDLVLAGDIELPLEQVVENINSYIELAVDTNLDDSDAETTKGTEIIKTFFKKEPRSNGDAMKMLEKCCRAGFEGSGELDFQYLKLECSLEIQSENSNNEETCPGFNLDVVKSHCKWNLYVGSILNLIIRRRYKTSEGRDNSSQGEPAREEADIIPVTSNEEESKLEEDNDDEENTIRGLFQEMSKFLVSVSLLDSFSKHYASTKHYRETKDMVKKLKATACDLLKNVKPVEFQFIYDQCRVSYRNRSLWWFVKPTLEEVFNRLFREPPCHKSSLEPDFKEFGKSKISKLPLHRCNFLKIFYFLEMDFGHEFTEEQWDDIFIYIHNFFEQFLCMENYLEADLLALLAIARLYKKIKEVFEKNLTKPIELIVAKEICLAWNEVVRSELYNKFVSAWKKLSKMYYNQEDIPPEAIIVLQNVGDILIADHALRKSEKSNECVDLEVDCATFTASPHAVIQITAFELLSSIVPDLVKLDTEVFGDHVTQMFHESREEETVKTTAEESEEDLKESSPLFKRSSNSTWTVMKISEEVNRNQAIVDTLLSDFIVGDCCTVEPFTDSFTYTYSYLLVWCFLLKMCGQAHSPLRFQYGCWFQHAGFSDALLESVFKLMPQTVLHGSEAKESCQKYFEDQGSPDYREPVESERIEKMACHVYRLFLEKLPNVVREWWNRVENKTTILVEKVTRLYVSPILIAKELRSLQQDRETTFENLEVKTYPNSREVVATYTIDEVKMDLIMILSPNYPLGTIKIESSNVLISTSHWRNWLFNICKYLIHQNGTIWDALVIWKNNLDKKFEGVEECYICFSILQGSSFEIPRLSCHTCRKKFHSNCLYKWFSTSNKSTCPICRNLF